MKNNKTFFFFCFCLFFVCLFVCFFKLDGLVQFSRTRFCFSIHELSKIEQKQLLICVIFENQLTLINSCTTKKKKKKKKVAPLTDRLLTMLTPPLSLVRIT